MFRDRYYTVLENYEEKDSRGNVIRDFRELKKVRGKIITKENKLYDEKYGLIINYRKVFITRRTNKRYLKIGYKVENLLIVEIFENGQDLVCMLEGI